MRRAARALARARCRRRGAADDSDGGAHRCGGHRLALSMPRAHRYLGSDALCNEFHKVVSWAAHIRDRLRTHRTISRAISSRRSLACGIKLRRVGPGSRRLARAVCDAAPGPRPLGPSGPGRPPGRRPRRSPDRPTLRVVEGSLLWWVPRGIRPGGYRMLQHENNVYLLFRATYARVALRDTSLY
jgi:hypothetical protein